MIDTINEERRLLAEFLGAEVYIGYKSPTRIDYTVSGPIVLKWRENTNLFTGGLGDLMMLENCLFNSSWDWIMMVVEKIENIKDVEGCYSFTIDIKRDWCAVNRNNLVGDTLIVTSFHNEKLKSTFKACVEFVNWYNQNKIK